jgi:soluble lytic murein transglycosylase-like protein
MSGAIPLSARSEVGQALLLVVGVLMAICLGALVLGGIAHGIGQRGDRQSAADLAALAGARAMHDAYTRVFEPATIRGRPNARHLERAEYLALGERAAVATAGRNGARDVRVTFPGGGLAPVRVRVTISDPIDTGASHELANEVTAEAELSPPNGLGTGGQLGAGEYRGPFAYRQGKPMRPDVAMAFDRMASAAHADGIELLITSAFRGDAEQARLFAAHPDPKWVARPGQSLHRLGTELDLGPPAAYGWLAANAERFHFTQRYAWEPWHFGFTLNAGTSSLGYAARATGAGDAGPSATGAEGGGASDVDRADGERAATLPDFVPERFAPAIAQAAQRWSVSGALLAAQLYQESGFNPFARSKAGAQGIAQFMPGTAAGYGLADPFDAERAIDAQAHLMRDLLRAFGAVPLALAAYNAGPVPVRACGCVPPIPETQAYVANILGLLNGAGDPLGASAGALEVRLVR